MTKSVSELLLADIQHVHVEMPRLLDIRATSGDIVTGSKLNVLLITSQIQHNGIILLSGFIVVFHIISGSFHQDLLNVEHNVALSATR